MKTLVTFEGIKSFCAEDIVGIITNSFVIAKGTYKLYLTVILSNNSYDVEHINYSCQKEDIKEAKIKFHNKWLEYIKNSSIEQEKRVEI